MSIYLRVPGYFFPPPWFNTLACHRFSSSSCSLFLCPFTCLTQTHSCLLIIKSGRCTSTQVFITSFIFCLWFISTCKYGIIYEVTKAGFLVTLICFLRLSFPPQITTGEACTCRWRWMGECQEVMFRRLTVSIWPLNTQRFLFYMIHLIIRSQRGCNNLKELHYFYFKGIYLSMLSGVLELKSVKAGHVVLKGKSSSLFLCVDSAGHLSGQVQ